MELPTLVCKNRRQLVVRKRNHPQPELEGRKLKKARKLFIPRTRENFQLTKLKCKGNSRNLTQAPPLHQLGPSLLCLWQQPKLNKWSHLPTVRRRSCKLFIVTMDKKVLLFYVQYLVFSLDGNNREPHLTCPRCHHFCDVNFTLSKEFHI